MKPVSIYDLSQRHQLEDGAVKRKVAQLPSHLQSGSVYDLNHVHAVTEHSQKQQRTQQEEVVSIYNCSIKH
jgi:hypothetical protein